MAKSEVPSWFKVENYCCEELSNESVALQINIRQNLDRKFFNICFDFDSECAEEERKKKTKIRLQEQKNDQWPDALYLFWTEILSGRPFSMEHIDQLNWDSDFYSFKGSSYCSTLNKTLIEKSSNYFKNSIRGISKPEYEINRTLFTTFDGALQPHLFYLNIEEKSDAEILESLKVILPDVRKRFSLPENLKDCYSKNQIDKVKSESKSLAVIDLLFWQRFHGEIEEKVLMKALKIETETKRPWPNLKRVAKTVLQSKKFSVE